MSPKRRSLERWFLYPKWGMAISDPMRPVSGAVVRPRLSVQRASRSFWRSLAGLSCQPSGIWPSLIAAFSASLLRCLGPETSEASMIWPDKAAQRSSRSKKPSPGPLAATFSPANPHQTRSESHSLQFSQVLRGVRFFRLNKPSGTALSIALSASPRDHMLCLKSAFFTVDALTRPGVAASVHKVHRLIPQYGFGEIFHIAEPPDWRSLCVG